MSIYSKNAPGNWVIMKRDMFQLIWCVALISALAGRWYIGLLNDSSVSEVVLAVLRIIHLPARLLII